MVKSRRHRSRKRSRKRKGSGAEVSLFGNNDEIIDGKKTCGFCRYKDYINN